VYAATIVVSGAGRLGSVVDETSGSGRTTSSRSAPPGRQAPWWTPLAVIGGAVLVGALDGLPLIGHLGSIGTLYHEASHALVADVAAGEVRSITVFTDGGGVAVWDGVEVGRLVRFTVAAAGYLGTAVVALALLTGTLFGRSSRWVALAAGGAMLVTWALWVPFLARVEGVSGGDQRYTWFLAGAVSGLLVAISTLPDAWRRVALGVLASSALAAAFDASDAVVELNRGGAEVRTDADTMADAIGPLGPLAWAWLLRLAVLAMTAAWAWWAGRRWLRALPQPADE
jgi:hypothetical protein